MSSTISTPWPNPRFCTSCPNREFRSGFHSSQNTKVASVALHASHDIHKLQVRQNLPHRIDTNCKCCTTCHTGSTQIVSDTCPLNFRAERQLVTDRHASQDRHKLQLGHVLCPFYPRQIITDSHTSQDIG